MNFLTIKIFLLNNESFYNMEIIPNEKNSSENSCLIWTTLPLISWFIPIIGHTGIIEYIKKFLWKYS